MLAIGSAVHRVVVGFALPAAVVAVSAVPLAHRLDASAPLEAVRYFSADNVARSFASGAVLDAQPGSNYMIHTSRRTAPGMAEVHEHETDLIYVMEGAATFVTGGTVVAPKTTAPGEIRGESIEGGETRHLSKGDVIVVPAGTPHWFQDVQPPVHYYTIKVRSEVKP